jgi:hypothetical protein
MTEQTVKGDREWGRGGADYLMALNTRRTTYDLTRLMAVKMAEICKFSFRVGW